jgi:hypothetical protein
MKNVEGVRTTLQLYPADEIEARCIRCPARTLRVNFSPERPHVKEGFPYTTTTPTDFN